MTEIERAIELAEKIEVKVGELLADNKRLRTMWAKAVSDASIAQSKIPKWISVSERLPDAQGEYLVAFHPCHWDNVDMDKTFVGLDTFRGKTTWAHNKYMRVTHWMPLPEPPNGGADNG